MNDQIDITDQELEAATKFRKLYASQIKKVSLVRVAQSLKNLVNQLAKEVEPKKPVPSGVQMPAQAANARPSS